MPRRLPKYCFEERRGNSYRVRFRRKNYPKKDLPGTPYSEEFMAAYRVALSQEPPEKPEPHGPTWGTLCARYLKESAAHKRLSLPRRRRYERVLLAICAEPIAPGVTELFGGMPLEAMTAKCVRVLHERRAEDPEAANERLKAIRKAVKYGAEMELVASNFARDVPYFPAKGDGFYTWTVEDVLQYENRHGPGTEARRAVRLLLYAGGPRRQDVVTLGRQHVKNGVIRYKPKKSESKGTVVEVPVLPELVEELERTPSGQLTFLQTVHGKPRSVGGFGNWFKARCMEAGLPQCSAHGLRKAGATMAAENGATEAQLMAIFGWEDFKMPARYTKKARRKKLAADAMHLVSAPTKTPQVLPRKKR